MPPLVALVGLGWIGAAAAMTALWAWQRRTGSAGGADAAWNAIVGGLAVLYATLANGMPGRRLAIASMLGSWGARLAIHRLYTDVLRRPEPKGDAELRRVPHDRPNARLFWIFQALAAAAVFFSLPALLASVNPAPEFSPIEYVAAGMWVIAFAGGATADRQRLHFEMDAASSGLTCRIGLWRYSRHASRMFEWLMWAACALFAAASPWGWLAFACPIAVPLAWAMLVRTSWHARVDSSGPSSASALR